MPRSENEQAVIDTLDRIQGHSGVVGYIVINADGFAIKTTLDTSTTSQYVQLMLQLNKKAISAIRDIDPTDNMRFLRLRSSSREIMVAPEKDYLLVVIQDPSN